MFQNIIGNMKALIIKIIFISLFGFFVIDSLPLVPTTINDVFMPGTQPDASHNFEDVSKCDNCHAGYDQDVEPVFNWRGSMMSMAAMDPLFYACLAIAEQDAPGVGDFCIRCHTPKGWLEGRSEPTDGSGLTELDKVEGISCDFCHSMVKPTSLNVNPYPEDQYYTDNTYTVDQLYLASLDSLIPPHARSGMYVTDTDNSNTKRGPFSDASANHPVYYSPFHQSSDHCATCHDVSNPVFYRDTINGKVKYLPTAFDTPAPDFNSAQMMPVERTYSEWSVSAYNSEEGVPSDAFGGNLSVVSTCQDCHMKDVTGKGCNKNGAPIRNDLPHHDMTGGNTFMPDLIADLYPNDVDNAALEAGKERAKYMLEHAATMVTTVATDSQSITVQVINETGHKLPSGYPEGRRIWIHVQAWGENGLFYESGAYEDSSAILTRDPDIKVYEVKPGISQSLSPIVGLPVGPSFHFVLSDSIFSDNRIPPRGFTNAAFDSIQSPPVAYSYADGQYWDDTHYAIPFSVKSVIVQLFYQVTSKEYVEFLRDENTTNTAGQVFYDLWAAHGKAAPEKMQDNHWGAFIWTGAEGTSDWFEDDNWNADKIPIASADVIIPAGLANYPIINDTVRLKSLKLENGAFLELLMPGLLHVKE
jgi:hypothetical protein